MTLTEWRDTGAFFKIIIIIIFQIGFKYEQSEVTVAIISFIDQIGCLRGRNHKGLQVHRYQY